MAKRLKKFSEVNGIKSKMLTLVDVMCPVCHEIFIEPVLLPCSHGMCLGCFESTVEKSNLSCPMCRKRLGSWLRSATKGKQLVNVKFWELIKQTFPDHVHAKLNGIETNEDVLFNNGPKNRILCSPGDIRREYQKSLEEFEKEQEIARKKHEEEERASENLIRQLQQEESNRRREEEDRESEELIRKLQEEEETRRKIELNQSMEDELIAKELQASVSKESASSGKKGIKTAERKKGPLDQFLTTHRSLSNLSDCSHDSIVQETHHFFRPVKSYPKTPPKNTQGGRSQEIPLVHTKPRNLSQALASLIPGEENIAAVFRSSAISKQLAVVKMDRIEQLRGGSDHSSAFSGCHGLEKLEITENCTKKARLSPPSPSPTSSEPVPSCSGLQSPAPEDVELQLVAERSILQERADLELAIRLQKEFDDIDRTVDRRKGTKRAYDLRDRRQTTLEEAFQRANREAH